MSQLGLFTWVALPCLGGLLRCRACMITAAVACAKLASRPMLLRLDVGRIAPPLPTSASPVERWSNETLVSAEEVEE